MTKSTAIVKVDSAENWAKALNYIPNSFTIVVYEFDNECPRIKIGDGIHKVNDLPFLNDKKEVIDDTLVV